MLATYCERYALFLLRLKLNLVNIKTTKLSQIGYFYSTCVGTKRRFYGTTRIKIPRLLRKLQDKEQIDKYCLIKNLCFEKNFNYALYLMTKWLNEPLSDPKNTVLILNGLLYSLCEENKYKEIDILIEIMNKRGIYGDRSTYTILIGSFAKRKDLNMVKYFLKELSDLSLMPHERSHMLAVKLLVKNTAFDDAVKYFMKLHSHQKESNDGFCAWFIASMTQAQQWEYVERIFDDFRVGRTRMGEQTMLETKRYFDSLKLIPWKTSNTEMSTSGICKNCQQKLEQPTFGKQEKDLESYFKYLINENLYNKQSNRTVHNSKNTAENRMFQGLMRFLRSKGPFDVIVDGLNVAMHPLHGLNFYPLYKLAEYFYNEGKRVLIMAANDLIRPKNASTMVEHQNSVKQLRQICDIYMVKQNQSGIDDLFLIFAGLCSSRENANIQIVSNDKFIDHLLKMKPEIAWNFERWLDAHQIMIKGFNKTTGEPLLQCPRRNAIVVQSTPRSWHFPSTANNTWLCVQQQSQHKQASLRRGNLSHAQQSKLRASDRMKEVLREENKKRIAAEKLLEANMDSEERVENKRFFRQLQQKEREREIEENLIQEKEAQHLREEQLEQEDRLAKELQRIKMEKTRDEKLRQQIRENSAELRELEAKLKAGYMNRERAAQLMEKQFIETEEQNRQAEIEKTMREDHEQAMAAETAKEQEKYNESVQYQQELEKQLMEQEQKKQEAYEEFLKEKLMIDEIVRKIYEEDQRELEKRMEKQRQTQQYIEEFKRKKYEWKEYETQLLEEENRRILEFAKEQQNREEERMEKKKVAEEAITQVQQKLANKIAQEQADRDEMERIRMELHMEEQEERERQREKSEIENKFRQRVDLQETRRQQLHYKELKRKAEIDEEEEFRRQMLAKFAEDDRIEQMNSQRRRMKQLEHKRAVEKLIEDRKEQFRREREAELESQREEERMVAYRRQIIEEERQRLLKEHAEKLLGYLPKGVLRDSRDLQMFDQNFQDAYSKRAKEFWEEYFDSESTTGAPK